MNIYKKDLTIQNYLNAFESVLYLVVLFFTLWVLYLYVSYIYYYYIITIPICFNVYMTKYLYVFKYTIYFHYISIS